MSLGELLPLIIPLVIVQLFLMAIALVDLFKEERRVRGGNKPIWALIIVFGELLGPLAYFFLGREEV
jgi:Phospholipase_D-nuclease N-terminal